MSQNTYNIGQVIYILSTKTQSVIPAIVTEEDIRKIRKSDGIQELVTYKLCVGPSKSTIDLSRINGDTYSSLEEIRKILTEKMTSYIDDLIGKAQKDVKEWYGINIDSTSGTTIANTISNNHPENKIDPERLVDQSYRPPSNVSNNPSHQLMNKSLDLTNQGSSPNNLTKERLRELIDSGEPYPGEVSEQTIILPDGSRQRVVLE